MKLTNFNLTGTYRPFLNETSFVFTLEPTIKNRPIIMLFMVDASHSMRFYIDEAKTIQRQSLVQAVAQMGINDHEIIQNDDRLGLFTFSTDVKSILEENIITVTENNRNELDTIVTSKLKSDGGQTNYGKAFDFLLQTIDNLKKTYPKDSPHLTGPILVWFLTDGRPWPEVAGNTTEDIFSYSTKIGESGNELWIIGISEDANKEFLDKIALSSELGSSDYNKRLKDLPKEFLLEEKVSEKTLWVDLDLSSQEQLMHGLVNAIEGARTNLGLVAEVEIIFQNALENNLEFVIGVNEVKKDGQLTKVTLKRYDFLTIGQKLSMAFSLKSSQETINQTSLQAIVLHLYRGEEKIADETVTYNQPLTALIKEETKIAKGMIEVRNAFETLRKNLQQSGMQLRELFQALDKHSIPKLHAKKSQLQELDKFLT